MESEKKRENLRSKNLQFFGERAQYYLTEAHSVEGRLNNLLTTLGTVIITLASPLVFGNSEQIQDLSDPIKVLITISLISLLLSIVVGFTGIINDRNFFTKWALNNNEGLEIWSKYSYPSEEQFTKMSDASKRNTLESDQTSEVPLILQSLFLGIGILMLLAGGILNMWSSTKTTGL